MSQRWADGSAAIELEERDILIGVQGMVTAVLPAMPPLRTLSAIFASRGARATSEEKRQSDQANGRNGGRPKKAERDEFVA